MTLSEDSYTLLPDPRANACGTLFEALKAGRGQPFQVNASAVEKMDTLVAQVLVLASKTWAADSSHFVVTQPSKPFLDALECLGLSDEIPTEGTAHVG